MAQLQIKKYYYKEEDDSVVFHPVVSSPNDTDELDLLRFRNKSTLRINLKLLDALTDCITKRIKKGKKK